jgi:predicted dehydrogenase
MKTAIIGMGPMGVRHVAAVAKVPELELVAVCDSRAEALENAGLDARVGRFARAEDLFAAAGPELVILATTAPSHHALTRTALQAGASRILCEKPVACSLRQAREMLDQAAARGAVLAVNHCRRHVPAYRWLAGQIRSGEWGALRGVRSACPGIGLGCLATHFLDLLRFLGGEDFVEVFGWVDAEKGVNPRGACFHDPGGLIVATGASGARYVHHQIEDAAGPYSLTLDLTSARISVEERDGKIGVIWRDPSVKPGPGRPPRFETLACPEEAPLRLDLVEMTAGVLAELARGAALTCAGEHGYKSLEAVVAAYGSHAAGHVAMPLPLTDPDLLDKELPIT